MSALVIIGDSSMPRLARGMRLQFDKQRDQWIIQAPERVFVLDAIATEILQRCTGEATVTAIVDELAGKFSAPRDLISRDVSALLQGFADKGVMTA